MRPFDAEGSPLRATFSVSREPSAPHAFTIAFECRGPGRNEDYLPALELLLRRLASLGAVLLDAVVASRETQALSVEERRLLAAEPYPITLERVTDLGRLRRQLTRAEERVGAKPGSRGGNSTKRIELSIRVPEEAPSTAAWLEALLAGGSTALDYEAIEAAARPSRPARGQGRGLTAAERAAVEQRAMVAATEHFEAMGFTVQDVSRNSSYDLECRREGERLLIEVKGTTGDPTSVLLTRNEVELARRSFPNMALFVFAGIVLTRSATSAPAATGGSACVLWPWDVSKCSLTPLTFECCLPVQALENWDRQAQAPDARPRDQQGRGYRRDRTRPSA